MVVHNGYRVPYQLHCWPDVELTLETTDELEELGTTELTTEDDELATEDLEDEVLTTLELTFDELEEVATLELDVEGAELEATAPAQAAPLITGISAVAPPLVP